MLTKYLQTISSIEKCRKYSNIKRATQRASFGQYHYLLELHKVRKQV